MQAMTRRLVNAIAAAVLTLSGVHSHAAAANDGEDVQLIERGRYLATAGDCIACHTAAGGQPFAGGLIIPTPVGDIVSTNITPSKVHGIGDYTLEQFDVALREGLAADGHYLYPAMPYTAYAKVTDEDVAAMYAYFMQDVEPVESSPPPTELPFPFNIRQSMAIWNLLFLDKQPYAPAPDKGELWNRGAYLAQGLTHCSTCHTPRNMFMAEDLSRELAGGEVGPWHAPNITPDPNSGVGAWSEQQMVDYLKSGHVDFSQASGPMAEAIDFSLRHMSEADLRAIATYLKTVPPVHDAADSRPAHRWGERSDALDTIRGVPWPADLDQMTGPQLYDAHCATCHQAQAQGSFHGGLPSLIHNTALGRSNTNNLVMVMLDGIVRHGDTPERIMPAYRTEMSNRQLATLGNYLTQRYGNPAAEVTVEQVERLRRGDGGGPDLVLLARVGMAAGAVALILILIGLYVYRRRRARVVAGRSRPKR